MQEVSGCTSRVEPSTKKGSLRQSKDTPGYADDELIIAVAACLPCMYRIEINELFTARRTGGRSSMLAAPSTLIAVCEV